ncbi:hypothetical protein RFI_14608, partial [Reticulomyxa filosa]
MNYSHKKILTKLLTLKFFSFMLSFPLIFFYSISKKNKKKQKDLASQLNDTLGPNKDDLSQVVRESFDGGTKKDETNAINPNHLPVFGLPFFLSRVLYDIFLLYKKITVVWFFFFFFIVYVLLLRKKQKKKYCKGCEPLIDNWKILTLEEREAAKVLIYCEQQHVMNKWPDPGIEDEVKKKLLKQVLQLNCEYPGGLQVLCEGEEKNKSKGEGGSCYKKEGSERGLLLLLLLSMSSLFSSFFANYYERAKKVLEDSVKGINLYDGYVPLVPKGEIIEFNSTQFHLFETKGMEQKELQKKKREKLYAYFFCGYVLVIGDLDERLGYDGIKVEISSEITTEISFMELYVATILALQTRARRATGDDQIKLPLAIMVSDHTIDKMQAFMRDHINFGMPEEQITWMLQPKYVNLANAHKTKQKNSNAEFAMEGKYEISSKRGGHGV